MTGCRFLFAALLLLGARPAQGQDAAQGESRLLFTNWRAAAYSHRTGGTVCWLEGEDGSLRLEVRQAPGTGNSPTNVAPLLAQEGEGWTLVLGPDDTGTLNAWGQEWRRPPAGLAQLVRLVTKVMVHYPQAAPETAAVAPVKAKQDVGRIPRPGFRTPKSPAEDQGETRLYELGNLDPEAEASPNAGDFRARMSARGRGTGGFREVVALTWERAPDRPGFGVRVSSSRRPGTLELEALRSQWVPTPEPEFFLPLWPMARFF